MSLYCRNNQHQRSPKFVQLYNVNRREYQLHSFRDNVCKCLQGSAQCGISFATTLKCDTVQRFHISAVWGLHDKDQCLLWFCSVGPVKRKPRAGVWPGWASKRIAFVSRTFSLHNCVSILSFCFRSRTGLFLVSDVFIRKACYGFWIFPANVSFGAPDFGVVGYFRRLLCLRKATMVQTNLQGSVGICGPAALTGIHTLDVVSGFLLHIWIFI